MTIMNFFLQIDIIIALIIIIYLGFLFYSQMDDLYISQLWHVSWIYIIYYSNF